MNLATPLSKVLSTTNEHISVLKEMGLKTVEDLLLYLPRTHEDLSHVQTILSAPMDEKGTFRGTITQLRKFRTRTGKQLVTGKFIDPEGSIAEAIWFNQPHIMRMLTEGDEVVLTGKLTQKGSKLQIQSPQFEREEGDALVHSGRLVAVYPQHDLINTKWLREKMVLVKDAISSLPENLPDEVLEEEELMSRADAIMAMHFPENGEEVNKAHVRLSFEEMYQLQCTVLQKKLEWQGDTQERLKIPMDTELVKAVFASLQFTPTDSQKIAIYEILSDMENNKPMSRLLEGDVGSGKTLVATTVMANTIRHGGQCALMVPTEVLAKQHAQSIGQTLINFYKYLEKEHAEGRGANLPRMQHPCVALLTGSVPAGEAKDIKQRLMNGTVDLVIGTHALIEDAVQFKDLKLVIVDEQHRFGVMQRQRLQDKGNPHFLSMTATPIPRTLALTAHGHHDLSVLMEKPGNRQPISTKVVSPTERKTVDLFIDQQISEGRQVFVICPLIKESENEDMMEIKSVQNEAKELQEHFAHRNIGMLHGKMSPQEKEEVMQAFKNREYDILVSTSVIEVGIDVPNASIILIEGSERFGLSQLHQFRGRVGRGEHKSYCFLFTTTESQARSARLKAMEQHDSGFMLAEIDLKIRGPGELYGLRQSGLPEIRMGGLMNPELVVRARRAAERAMKTADPVAT